MLKTASRSTEIEDLAYQAKGTSKDQEIKMFDWLDPHILIQVEVHEEAEEILFGLAAAAELAAERALESGWEDSQA